MNDDSITSEVKRIRDEHARILGYNLHAIAEAYRVKEAEGGRTLITLHPKLANVRQEAM